MGAAQPDWGQPLVWVVAAIFGAGVAVGLFVADPRTPSYALGSELVYRVEIGGVVVAVLLFVLTTLRLGAFGRMFTSFAAGPVTAMADDPASAMDAAVIDVEGMGAKVDGIAAEVADLLERVADLERRVG